jgi:hypothetical protein
MNWYFENRGISEGPVTETVLAMRVQKGEIVADTLIWNPSLEAWQTVQALRPDWLIPVIVAAAMEAKAPPMRPATRPLAPSTSDEGTTKVGFFKKIFGGGKKS